MKFLDMRLSARFECLNTPQMESRYYPDVARLDIRIIPTRLSHTSTSTLLREEFLQIYGFIEKEKTTACECVVHNHDKPKRRKKGLSR